MFHFFRHIRNERWKHMREDITSDLHLILPQLNALCEEEYIQLEKSSVIDVLCKQIYTEENTIARLIVGESELWVTYANKSVLHISFCDLGMRDLSYKVFDAPELMGSWNLATDAVKTEVDQFSYLDFCQFCSKLHRNAEAYTWSPGFDEKRAVAHIIAQKSGISFHGPTRREQSPDCYVEEVKFNAPLLPAW